MSGAQPWIDSAACAAAVQACACQNLRSAARAVTRYFDDCLSPSGLRSTQFVVLAAIHGGDPAALPRLARELGLDRSALTRSLRPLTDLGLVQILRPQGGRTALAALTDKGRDVLSATVPLWQRAQERFVERLGDARWASLSKDLPAALDASRDLL